MDMYTIHTEYWYFGILHWGYSIQFFLNLYG